MKRVLGVEFDPAVPLSDVDREALDAIIADADTDYGVRGYLLLTTFDL